MRYILLICVFVLSLQAQNILLINSNSNIDKYNDVVKSFQKTFKQNFTTIDITDMKQNEIKEYLYDVYPDIIYAVGSKAYQYANSYLPEKKIFFSSIVNWKRLDVNDRTSGVSNELYSGMQLTLIKAFFKDIKKIGIVYSKYTVDLHESFKENAKLMGIEITSQKILDSKDLDYDSLIKNSEAFIAIPDPILMSSESNIKQLFTISNRYKKPVFAYDSLFVEYGAVLVSSVDNPTIGRQVASMIQDYLNAKMGKNIQFPMGTNIIFNKKSASKLDIQYNKSALSIANKVIE